MRANYTYLAGVLLNVGRVEEAEAAIERALAGLRGAQKPGAAAPPGGT
jgi:hypothetical protein